MKLEESFREGRIYRVSTRVDLSGALTPPAEKGKPAPKPLSVKGDSAIDYDERLLTVENGEVRKTIRLYGRMDFEQTLGDRPQTEHVAAGGAAAGGDAQNGDQGAVLAGRPADLGRDRSGADGRVHAGPGGDAARPRRPRRRPLERVRGRGARADRHGAHRRRQDRMPAGRRVGEGRPAAGAGDVQRHGARRQRGRPEPAAARRLVFVRSGIELT